MPSRRVLVLSVWLCAGWAWCAAADARFARGSWQSAGTPAYPLRLDTAIDTTSGAVNNAVIAGASLQ